MSIPVSAALSGRIEHDRRPAHNAPMDTTPRAELADEDIHRLQGLLDAVPAPLEPLDVMALDGYLCGVILQPRPVAASRWLAGVTDVDQRALPEGFDATELHRLVRRRHAELERAITRREWFDPWIFSLAEGGDAEGEGVAANEAESDTESSEPPSHTVLPWIAGFAAAQDPFPDLLAIDDPALLEPLALLYLHIPREDLEDADALIDVIESIEPPETLAEAVEEIVRAVMLIADVSRPKKAAPKPGPQAAKRSATDKKSAARSRRR